MNEEVEIPSFTARLLALMGWLEGGIDCCDGLFWRTDNGKISFHLILDSGTSSGADLEEVANEEDMDLLEEALAAIRDVDDDYDYWAPELFASWKRKSPLYSVKYPETIAHLFWSGEK